MIKTNRREAARENARHGDIFLPVNSYHCLVPVTYRELALHWHEEMEITMIREGMSNYRVGERIFRAEEGDLILIPPYCVHSAYEIPGETMTSDSLVFHPDLLGAQGQDLSASRYLRPLAEGRLQMPEVIRTGDEGYEEIREVFLNALECFQTRPPFYEILLKSELLQEIFLLFRNGLQFIAEHYRDKIKVSELAQLSGFSESYFMSFFKQNVGMSCISYINHYRVQRAANALEETTQPVMDIAMDNGFDNISYFNLQFRRAFGMTPREFRSRQKEGA